MLQICPELTVQNVAKLIASLEQAHKMDRSVEVLANMGEAVLDPLVKAMCDKSHSNTTREICAQLVGQIVPSGVERLLGLLRSATGDKADLAAWGLRWNHGSDLAEPELIAMLNSTNALIRANAARAFRYIHVSLSRCDSLLLAKVDDSNPSVRGDILHLLLDLAEADVQEFGLTEKEVISVARKALQENDDKIKKLAQRIIQKLQ